MVPHFLKVLYYSILFSCFALYGQSTGAYVAMYSDQLGGTALADGSLYAPQRMVISHPFLPFGAKVKLTNLQNHFVVEAFVADRPGADEQNLLMISRKVAESIGIGAGEVKLVDVQLLQYEAPVAQIPTQLSGRAALVEPPPPPLYQPPTNNRPEVVNTIPPLQQATIPVINRPQVVNTIPPLQQQVPTYQPPIVQPPIYNRPQVINTIPPQSNPTIIPPIQSQPTYTAPIPTQPRDIIYASPTARPNVAVIPSTPIPVSQTGNFLQQGVASYYGDQFQGRLTANGEIFNKNDLTAAHQALPFNSIIRVTVVETGKYIDVRVNDRGPYVGTRILDLSEKAAKEVGLFRKGTAEVQITLLRGPRGETTVAQLTQRFVSADPRVQNSGVQPSSHVNLIIPEFTIQLGAYRVYEQALTATQQVNGAWVETSEQDGKVVYRLNYRHFPNREEANVGLREVQRLGYTGFVRQVVN